MTEPVSGDTPGDLRRWLAARTAELVGTGADRIDLDRPFTELGLSSVQAVSLAADLSERTGRELPATLVWQRPTIAGLVDELVAGRREPSGPTSVAGSAPPIAVVGAGGRLPGGVESLEDFWTLLTSGDDAVGEVPDGRWEQFGHSPDALADVPRSGAFLDDVAGFDAEYFGISPREAELMDPQQRILLEVATAAVEHAGIPLTSLRGTRTGVFVGASSYEYAHLTTTSLDGIEPWTATGAAPSVLANRLSYLLDLRGPSMTVDTACSSSLVALHQAARALADGEIDTALVGGVNLLLGPSITVNFARAGVLAANGRCKAFDAAADGIVRGEGCVVVVLRRLAQARQDGSRIMAVIRGSAVNSDGRSNGLMAPNPLAQQDLLRQAYASAGLHPSDVDYVEAHGTGTPLGDPIEAGALGAVLGHGRDPRRPLLIGSVKATLGHLEAAAGLAGLLKVVLAMTHQRIPPSPHYHEPNPLLDPQRNRLAVVRETMPWPRYSGQEIAGVSAFGFGGTNAHVVLEAWPQRPARVPVAGGQPEAARTIALSGLTEQRLRSSAGRLAEHLSTHPVPLADLAHTLACRRDHGPVRASVVATERAGLVRALRAIAGAQVGSVTPVRATSAEPGVVWVFSGHGSQYPGMARDLLATEPAFAAEVDRLDKEFRTEVPYSLREAMTAPEAGGGLYRAQLTLFGIQLALAGLWRSLGVAPAAIIGHSMGEVAAAVASGALDVRAGIRVMSARARLLEGVDAAGTGAMAAVELSEAEFTALTDLAPEVTVAVYAAPRRLTVTGPADQVGALVRQVEGRGRFARPLGVGAGHSRAVEPVLDELRECLADVTAERPSVPCYSTSMPDPRDTPDFGAEYWARNLRMPVRFAQAVGAALSDGHRAFLELSPHPIAVGPIEENAREHEVENLLCTGTLRRREPDSLALNTAIGLLHAHGHPEVLAARHPSGRLVDLPTPDWQHRRHWITPPRAIAPSGHPLLGPHVPLPEGDRHVWHADVGTAVLPWLADHRAYGIPVLPGSAYLELVLAAAAEVFDTTPDRLTVRDLEFQAVLSLADRTEITTSLVRFGSAMASVEVFGRGSGTEWTRHAVARIEVTPAAADEPVADLPVDREVDVYACFASIGQHYGPAFQGVEQAGVSAGTATGRVRLPAEATTSRHYLLHPALIDAALQVLAAAVVGDQEPEPAGSDAYLPVAIGSVRVRALPPDDIRVVATVRADGQDGDLLGTVRLSTQDGSELVVLEDVRLRRLPSPAARDVLNQLVLARHWERADLPARPSAGRPGTWLVLTPGGAEPDWVPSITAGLRRTGHRVVVGSLLSVAAALTEVDADGAGPLLGVLLAGPPAEPGALPGGTALIGGEGLVLTVAGLVGQLVERAGRPPRLWLVTQGAAAVDEVEAGWPATACLRGLVRVLGFEHPELRASAFDLDPESPADISVAALFAELIAEQGDDEVAVRAGTRLVARIGRPALPPAQHRAPAPVTAGGGYLITGGLGGLGLVVARWLARGGAGRIVLSARREPTERIDKAIAEIRGLGAEVVVVLGDVAGPGVAERLVAATIADDVPLRGVVHAAGVLDDAATALVGEADLHRVWWPKVHGAWRLHEATLGHDVDWWIGFSSVAALLGSPGQAAYATANAWLDALMIWRRANGLPATTINWGAWSEVGGAEGSDNPVLATLTPAEGIDALDAVLRSGRTATGVSRLAVDRIAEMFPGLLDRPFYGALLTVPATPSDQWPGISAVRAAGGERARRMLATRLRARIADIAGFPVAELPVGQPLRDLGLDSLMAMRARNAVQQDFDVVLPIPLLLRGASLLDVEEFLAGELALADAAPARPSVGPRDATERLVALAWRSVLGIDEVDVAADFFAVGGDEDLARRITEELGTRFGRPLDAATLFAEPTVEAIADMLREYVEPARDEVVRVLRAGSDAPLFLFHPAGGPTSVYQPLVHRLPDSVPCYGFERVDEVEDVAGKAAHYVGLLKDITPSGPVRLGGWSFGGCLAQEVARQLSATGTPVELVAMIDAILPLPEPGEPSTELIVRRYRRLVEHLQAGYGSPIDVPWERLAEADEQQQIALLMTAVADIGIGEAALRHQYTSYVDARAAERHRPARYDGRVVLYRASAPHPLTTTLDPRYLRTDDTLGWDEFCPDLDVVRIPGDHLSVIDPPNVDLIAAHLGGLL